MNIYAIGDLHLSFDSKINKPMDVFGPEWENHTEKLKKNWMSSIKEEDVVILCGDISWGLKLEESLKDLTWIDTLPGTKVITKGNHDLWWTSIKKLNAISDRLIFLQNTAYNRNGISICGTRGWIMPGTEGFDEHDEKIYRRELLRLERSLKEAASYKPDKIIASLHYPPCNDRFQSSGFMELLSSYGVDTCVYGHLHGEKSFKSGFQGLRDGVKYMMVSLDYVNAVPKKIL